MSPLLRAARIPSRGYILALLLGAALGTLSPFSSDWRITMSADSLARFLVVAIAAALVAGAFLIHPALGIFVGIILFLG